ncbi:hypothetical protein [Halalkalibacter flavus]|uniref:hypothetical protein n=1 Tax=Halalkalibacter flavus TaxID=3090668 RepID=UPI002FC5D706
MREDNITFINYELSEIKNEQITQNLDAVFITKEFLLETTNDEYADVYRTAGIPFFFIESKKSYTPFIEKATSYNDVPTVKDNNYATGYLHTSGDEGYYWSFGLYNDVVNKKNIEDAYTRIFETIQSSTF